MTCRIHLTTSLLSTLAITATAQRPDSLAGEVRQTFREVRAVHELPDGRTLVLDSHERFVYLADFRTGDVLVIGEHGMADRQYLWPSRLLHRADDTTLVWDAIEGRIHVLDWVGGEPAIRRSIHRSAFSPTDQSWLSPVASDRQGRMYSEVKIGVGGSALVRWIPGAERVDTLFRFRRANLRGVFPAWDQWTVSSTGVVAYVHVSPYRIDLRGPGANVVAGTPIAFDPKPVTADIQKAWLEALRQPQIMWSRRGREPPKFSEISGSGVDYTGPWPVATPAIVARKPLMQFTSEGSLLIERAAVPALPSEYDVIDEQARLKDRFELPAGTRIVATGRGVVYVTVRGPDSRLKLQRFTVRGPR
jgi:hypothetical protein